MKAIVLISVLAIFCGVLPIVYSMPPSSVLTDDKDDGNKDDGNKDDGKDDGNKDDGNENIGFEEASIDQEIRDEQGNLILADPAFQIDYMLYTRENKINPEILEPENITDTFIHGDAHRGTIFIFHGFTSSGDADWVKKMKDELLTVDNFNVIVVNWREGAKVTWTIYVKAAKNTRIVGQRTANLIEAMEDKKGIGANKTHLIGHSLGAHCAGFTGKRIWELTLYRPSRISGLDPAGPLFANSKAEQRLDETDANFVDIIHTNDGNVFKANFGWKKNSPLGHADFYPNGGSKQPGCKLLDFTCNHGRAPLLYINSIRECEYQSRKGAAVCPDGPDIVRMGYYAYSGTPFIRTLPFPIKSYGLTKFRIAEKCPVNKLEWEES